MSGNNNKMEHDIIPIFLLDDEEEMNTVHEALLEQEGFKNVKSFTNPDDLLKEITEDIYIMCIDFRLRGHGMNGIDVIKKILTLKPACYFIMLSGYQDSNIILDFNHAVLKGKFIVKGEKDTDELIIRSLYEFIYDYFLMSSLFRFGTTAIQKLDELNKLIKGS